LIEFVLFSLTLISIAIWHRHALRSAVVGLVAVIAWQLSHGGVSGVPGATGLLLHLQREATLLSNLLMLLTGFAMLARHVETSGLPQWLPKLLPNDWTGGLWLLIAVFVLSIFLDNIAAALIGGTVARGVFRHKVSVTYVAALVAAANAGGAGSVVGDTTTTMMWLSGVAPSHVARAFMPAAISLLLLGVPASWLQQRHAPIQKDPSPGLTFDVPRQLIAGLMLLAALLGNLWLNIAAPKSMQNWPCMGLAVWLVLLSTAGWRKPDWRVLPSSARGAMFLLSLVLMASLMPVTQLPAASHGNAVLLGVVSAVFDNIPLTKLAIEQGGYDWGLLAYAVGFGGSLMWFGSSAGVALCGLFPEARNMLRWLGGAWWLLLAYLAGVAWYLWLW
jgi:Na+/H+ antiporter NhaD/arsenite permease-like protein